MTDRRRPRVTTSAADAAECPCARDSCAGDCDAAAAAQGAPRLVGYTLAQLRAANFPQRPALLLHNEDAVIRSGDISMIYAPRGTGKSLLAGSIALAVAAGRRVLRWHAPEARPVLFIDGEMPSHAIRARMLMLAERMEVTDVDARVVIVGRDWQETFLPNLDTVEGQAAIEPFITADTALVIADNISTLFDVEAEKDPAAWSRAQAWLLELRRRGIATLLIHHASRTLTARGHSRREDIMDVILKLTRPDGYRQDEGARFRVEFDKARGFYGAAAEPFVASLTRTGWTVGDSGPPSEPHDKWTTLKTRVEGYVSGNGWSGASKNQVRENVPGRAVSIDAALKELVDEGRIVLRNERYCPRGSR